MKPFFTNLKYKTTKELLSDKVFNIECNILKKIYIDQTSQRLKTRCTNIRVTLKLDLRLAFCPNMHLFKKTRHHQFQKGHVSTDIDLLRSFKFECNEKTNQN